MKKIKFTNKLLLCLFSILFIMNGCKKENDIEKNKNKNRPTIVEVAKSPEKFGYKKVNSIIEESWAKKKGPDLSNFNVYYNQETNSTYAIRKKSSNSALETNTSASLIKDYYYFRSWDCIMSGAMSQGQNPLIADDSGDFVEGLGAISIDHAEELIIYGESYGAHNFIAGEYGTFRLTDWANKITLDVALNNSPEGWIYPVSF